MKDRARRYFALNAMLLVVIALLCLYLAWSFLWNKSAQKQAEVPQTYKTAIVRTPEKPGFAGLNTTRVEPPSGQDFFESVPQEFPNSEEEGDSRFKDLPATPPPPVEEPLVKTIPPARTGKARVAIIIDDIGMDIRRSERALRLPAPVTLAMLPYAPRVRSMAQEASQKGHTLIIHAPMEAMDGHANIGPGGLKEGMSATEIKAAFDVMTKSFEGYEGINNHMGSRLTQDEAAMATIMDELQERGLFFVDSKTSARSVAERMAAQKGLAHAGRDVFLDNEDTQAFVDSALKKTERLALSRGYAIAIGHPKDHTLTGLEAWIRTLAAKGIELVSVKALLSYPEVAKHSTSPEPRTNLPEVEDKEMVEVTVDRNTGKSIVPEAGKGVTDNTLPASAVGVGENNHAVTSEQTKKADEFFDDVNKAFAPSGGEPEIELHPLPPQ